MLIDTSEATVVAVSVAVARDELVVLAAEAEINVGVWVELLFTSALVSPCEGAGV